MPIWKDLWARVAPRVQKFAKDATEQVKPTAEKLLRERGEVVQDLLEDPRVSRAVNEAVKARGIVQDQLEGVAQKAAKSLGIATRDEVRDLKRTIRKLEEELKKRE